MLVLASALLHASWNLIVKGSQDRLIAGFAQAAFGAIVFSPVLFISGIPTEVWPAIALSSFIHLTYTVTLVTAYNHGDMSLVYPVARGTAPILVTIAAALLLDDVPSVAGMLAIALAVGGVFWVAAGKNRNGIWWAILTGGIIAAYTVNDAAAVRSLEAALPYTIATFFGQTLLLIPVIMWRRSLTQAVTSLRMEWRRHLFAGMASAGAYALVLSAARLAPLGLVAAFRETSVVFGTLGGLWILKEPAARSRLKGAALIAAGLVVLVISS